jgi:hypothetical protein
VVPTHSVESASAMEVTVNESVNECTCAPEDDALDGGGVVVVVGAGLAAQPAARPTSIQPTAVRIMAGLSGRPGSVKKTIFRNDGREAPYMAARLDRGSTCVF